MSAQLTSALGMLRAGANGGVLLALAGALAPPERAALTLFLDSLSGSAARDFVEARPEVAQACIVLARLIDDSDAAHGEESASSFATLVAAAQNFAARATDGEQTEVTSTEDDGSEGDTLNEDGASDDSEFDRGTPLPPDVYDLLRGQLERLRDTNHTIAALVEETRSEFEEMQQAIQVNQLLFAAVAAAFLDRMEQEVHSSAAE